MMKKKTILSAVTFLLLGLTSFSQNCDEMVKDCEKLFRDEKGKEVFISDGQVYTAFLDRQQAEFDITFYGGTTYRIAVSAGDRDDYVIFRLRDQKGNVLFSNQDYKNARYWDFKVPQTITLKIETELDTERKIAGCAVMLIGFKQ
ncbi:MAG: hypothetical protein M9916_07985 [Crocinitomicaceae bacterium]|nr:hypothetical protein [Crocinitomicaceae bacterium]